MKLETSAEQRSQLNWSELCSILRHPRNTWPVLIRRRRRWEFVWFPNCCCLRHRWSHLTCGDQRMSEGGERWNYISPICCLRHQWSHLTCCSSVEWEEEGGQRDHLGLAIMQIYLFQLQIIFVQMSKYICLNANIYLYGLKIYLLLVMKRMAVVRNYLSAAIMQIFFPPITDYICSNCQIYLSQCNNIFVIGDQENEERRRVMGISHWGAVADNQLDFKWNNICLTYVSPKIMKLNIVK